MASYENYTTEGLLHPVKRKILTYFSSKFLFGISFFFSLFLNKLAHLRKLHNTHGYKMLKCLLPCLQHMLQLQAGQFVPLNLTC